MSYIFGFCFLIPFYLLGSFPSGRLIASRNGIDITQLGSGNVGATNVARVVGKKAALLTLALDIGKGLLGVSLARTICENEWLVALAATALVSGHCFSIPGKWRGGKGVATALGALLGLQPLIAVFGLVAFVTVFVFSQIASLSSVTAVLTVPLAALIGNSSMAVTCAAAIIALVVTWRHWPNLMRLAEGREKKFEFASISLKGQNKN